MPTCLRSIPSFLRAYQTTSPVTFWMRFAETTDHPKNAVLAEARVWWVNDGPYTTGLWLHSGTAAITSPPCISMMDTGRP